MIVAVTEVGDGDVDELPHATVPVSNITPSASFTTFDISLCSFLWRGLVQACCPFRERTDVVHHGPNGLTAGLRQSARISRIVNARSRPLALSLCGYCLPSCRIGIVPSAVPR